MPTENKLIFVLAREGRHRHHKALGGWGGREGGGVPRHAPTENFVI